jgi:hypothetical protein
MQWKDYETEIAHREKIRLGLRKVRESYLSPFSNPITLHGNNAPSMGQLVSFANQAVNNLLQQQAHINSNMASPPNLSNLTSTNLKMMQNNSNSSSVPLTTPSNNIQRSTELSPTETIALVAAAAAEAALQASPYNSQKILVDEKAFATVATAAATAAASAYLGRNERQNLINNSRSSSSGGNNISSNKINNTLDNIENVIPSPLMTIQNSHSINNVKSIVERQQQFYKNNSSLNISFSKSLASSRSSGMDSIRRRRKRQDGGTISSGASNNNIDFFHSSGSAIINDGRLRNGVDINYDIIPSPTNTDSKLNHHSNSNFNCNASPTNTNLSRRSTPNPLLSSFNNDNNIGNELLEKYDNGIVVRSNTYNNSNCEKKSFLNSLHNKPYKIKLTPGKIKEISPSNKNEKQIFTEIDDGNAISNSVNNSGDLFFRKTGILTYDHSPPRKNNNSNSSNSVNEKGKLNINTPLKVYSNSKSKLSSLQKTRLKALHNGTPRLTNSPLVLKSAPNTNINNTGKSSPSAQSGSGLSGEDLGGLSFTPSKSLENDDEEYHPDDLVVLKAIEQADRYTPVAQNKKIGKLKGNLGYKSTDRKQKQWERRYSQLQQMSYSPAGKN